MKVAFIVLSTDIYLEEAKKEIEHIRKEVLSQMKHWRLEKVTILPTEEINKSSTQTSK